MSQDLYALLRERARLNVMGWPLGLMLSCGLHVAVVGAALFLPEHSAAKEDVKVTWVTLPAMGGTGSGGSAPMEEGKQGERNRRVEEVAPQAPPTRSGASSAHPSPDFPSVPSTKTPKPAKAPLRGTNPDPNSRGTAPVAAKGANPVKNPTPGAAGRGGGGGIGEGTGIPGLRASYGVQGGTGLVGDLDSNFPFVWYLSQVQNTITGNWNRLTAAQGRVQIYFRIRRDGRIEGERVEIPSGNGTLDQSALMAVKRSNPLPHLPDGFEADQLGIRFWFTYLGN